MPCFNEAESVAEVVRQIRGSSTTVDILVVDDGSADDTISRARQQGAIVAPLPINLGIGAAVQTGYRYARANNYDIAIQVDGDGQHPATEIARLIAPLLRGEADCAIGSRYVRGLREGKVSSMSRVLGTQLLSWVIFLLSGKRISDPTSGFRAVNSKLIALFAADYPYDYPEPVSLLTILVKGRRVVEVAVRMAPRLYGRSSIRSLRSVLYMVKVTWTMCLKRIYG